MKPRAGFPREYATGQGVPQLLAVRCRQGKRERCAGATRTSIAPVGAAQQ
jgi:hypothetical protein